MADQHARLTEADENGDRRVIDLIDGDPADRFHPEIAAEFISVPAATTMWSTKNGSTWTHRDAPVAAEPVQQYRTSVTPVEFFGLFTVPEEVAIRDFAEGDSAEAKAMAIYLRRLDRAETLDFKNAQVRGGLSALLAAGLITQERHDEIVRGVPV